MKACLSEEALVRCATGDGTPEEKKHLCFCLGCAASLRRLESELALMNSVLRQPPPVDFALGNRRTTGAIAAAVASLVVFGLGFWGGTRALERPSQPLVARQSEEPQIVASGPAVRAVLGGVDGCSAKLTTSAAYLVYLQSAVADEDLCPESEDPIQEVLGSQINEVAWNDE